MTLSEQVAALWAQDKTSTEIAAALNISRNSVMGFVHRLRRAGLIQIREKDKDAVRKAPDGRKRASRKKVAKPKPKVERKPGPARGQKPAKTRLPPKPVEILPWTPPSGTKTVLTLRLMDCRYIVAGAGLDAVYCGQPKERGSYCAEHGARCYIAPKPGRRRERPLRRQASRA